MVHERRPLQCATWDTLECLTTKAADGLAQVTNLAVYDTVVPLDTGIGTWRQAAVVDAVSLHPVPRSLPLQAAATMVIKCARVPVQACTRYLPAGSASLAVKWGGGLEVMNFQSLWVSRALRRCCLTVCSYRGQRSKQRPGDDPHIVIVVTWRAVPLRRCGCLKNTSR